MWAIPTGPYFRALYWKTTACSIHAVRKTLVYKSNATMLLKRSRVQEGNHSAHSVTSSDSVTYRIYYVDVEVMQFILRRKVRAEAKLSQGG